ncbi:MAG: hypothetical protein ACRC3Y_14480 [Romboutsia sp.]|uniref:hypothetical protein n=1 Tax=Romboutsia sp. TaxID=1965302 RepID=UPI003F3BC9B6
MNEKNYTKALDLLYDLKSEYNSPELEEKIKITSKLKEDTNHLSNGILLFEEANYNEAISKLNQVSNTNIDLYNEAQAIIDNCISNIINQNIETIQMLIHNKDFVEAHRYINEITELDSENETAKEFVEIINIELAKMKVDGYLSN